MPPLVAHDGALPYRPDIDGLRAFAVLAVIGYHFFPAWVKGGFVGVDIFFVISGFLIGGILLDSFCNNAFSLLDFYARRIRRILPALILVMVTSLTFGWFALLPDDYQNLGKHTAGGAGFVSNLILWTEVGYFDVSAERKPLLHLWSLGVEEQFYIVFPLFLWFLWAKRLRTTTFLCAFLSVSFALNLALYKHEAFAFYMPLTRFWELAAGAMLALLKQDSRITCFGSDGRNFYPYLSISGFLILILMVFTTAAQSTLSVLGTMCIIVAGFGKSSVGWFNGFLSWRPVVAVGLISYPLYLWHWPLISYACIILGAPPDFGSVSSWLPLSSPLSPTSAWNGLSGSANGQEESRQLF
jgi:peptidoglycan/LPS O-acetylase OafA/YrhL